ncbi:Allergen Asp f 7 -like protein [Ceratocystis lukuohia]|uniref:Allergen Asp f 7 -like protein n=1 Tax=Ceratocystis lukuohia TaxID=2019550 RepID=A0ABR4MPF5_9PEZI
MKSAIIASTLFAAASVVAQPHNRHGHDAFHKRSLGPRRVANAADTWDTVDIYDYVNKVKTKCVYETAWVTVIEWVDSQGVATQAPDTIFPGGMAPATTTTESAPAQTDDGLFYEHASSSSSSSYSAPAPPPATTLQTITTPKSEPAPTQAPVETPSSEPVYVPTSSTPVAAEYVAPTYASENVEPTTSAQPVYVAPSSTSEPVYQAPAASSAAPAAQSSTTTTDNSGSGEESGYLTYYDLGMGACGFDDSGKDETDYIIAISKDLMGTQSNGNPYCGKTATITGNGKTITATIRDKCMGCTTDHIDGSKKIFLDLFGSLDAGKEEVTFAIAA